MTRTRAIPVKRLRQQLRRARPNQMWVRLARDRPRDKFFSSVNYIGIDSLARLVWTARQVVVATVVEQLPSAWGPVRNPRTGDRYIHTDLLAQVEQRLRGQPADTLRIRLPGGTIGGFAQASYPTIPLSVGVRALLFLNESHVSPGLPQAYWTVGGPQGVWLVKPDNTVKPALAGVQLTRYAGTPMADVTDAIAAILDQPPPDTPWAKRQLVSLAEAPPAPSVTRNSDGDRA